VDKVNILLVDDQPARLLTYESILGDLGQNLVSATSGREALARLMKDEFAVVLMDVSMPDMDGFEVARLIHEHPRFEKTPIIFVTAVHVTELDRLKGYKLGAVDYVSVPLVPQILRSKVSVLVELYYKRRELQAANRNLAQANAQLAQANTTLQAEKTRELERLNRILQHANAELEAANRSLQSEVTERLRVEQALKDADRRKDEFLAMLAHELRNPLAPICNAIYLMRQHPTQDPQVDWSREVIERQLTHLTRLVDDLLDVSRITRGKITLKKELVEVAPLVARAVETVQPLIDERGHQLAVELPNETLCVRGDPTRLTQALANVLSNAAKYTDKGGRIAVSGQVRGDEIELRVRDTGIGIPAEHLPVIFDLFTQLDESSGRTQSGLGIGLALVRQLVQMHGGRITAHSDGPGQGSEFLISLPLRAEPATPVQPPERDAPPAEECTSTKRDTTRGQTILVADDNADALESLAMLLELSGHRIHTACDGQQALELAERVRPEVALLDIGMPVLDGYEVARRIRAQPWGERMMLVALTGRGQDCDRQRAREAGFSVHLVKPVDLDELTEVLARAPVQNDEASSEQTCRSRTLAPSL
jgi:signal transduction histidine kinase